jgi:hypothetical protein
MNVSANQRSQPMCKCEVAALLGGRPLDLTMSVTIVLENHLLKRLDSRRRPRQFREERALFFTLMMIVCELPGTENHSTSSASRLIVFHSVTHLVRTSPIE